MKYAITQLEAVRSFYAGEKIRVRFYADGKETAKANATEFTVSGSDRVYEEPVVEVKARKERTSTKASVLRSKIKEMLADEEFDYKQAVEFAVEKLSMKKPLARVYVKNAVAKLQSVDAAQA